MNQYSFLSIEQRFWSKVNKSQKCWEWLASRSPDGYGVFKFRGAMRGAHRVAWILQNGEIPDGLHVLHSCDNPYCVNPSHLWLGTNSDNVGDRVTKGRSSSGKLDGHGRAKLSSVDIVEIRSRLSRGEYQKDIAIDYGVSQPCIGYIARGETWNGVQ